jgi:hypothetical protein
VPLQPDTIGGWTVSEFQKQVREMVNLLAPTNLGALTVDDLIVVGSLTAQGSVTYSSKNSFFTIGASGQPGFLNSWVAYGAPYQAPAFIKTEDGWVRPRGSMKSGTVGSAAFQLAPGFRPANTVAFATAGSGVVGIVEIDKNGNVTPLSPSTNTRVSLDGIQFKAA